MTTKSPRSKLEGVRPNDQNLAILDWVVLGKGSAIVRAYAGTGKSTQLLLIVREIIKRKLGTVFLGAYNKPIAAELEAELKLMGVDWRDGQASTMHSAGFKLCRYAWNGVVVDEQKVLKLINSLCSDFADRNASTIKQGVSLAKQTGIGVRCGGLDNREWVEMFDHYGLNDIYEGDSQDAVIRMCQTVLYASNDMVQKSVDYDDMVYAPLFHKLRVRYPFDWVLGDECQDWNWTRTALAFKLLAPGGRMVAVGDSNQSIYGFSGAQTDAMENIAARMAEESDSGTVPVFPLSVTYRCPKVVVKEAQQYVKDYTAHASAPEGVLRRMDLQAPELKPDEIAKLPSNVLRFCEFDPTDAVLCRNTKPLVELTYELIRARIPCRVEGRDIGEGLKKIAGRWKVKTLDALRGKLEKYLERERAKWTAKGREERVASADDKVQTLVVLIEICEADGKHNLIDLHNLIDSMFSDTPTGSDYGVDAREVRNRPRLTLCTIHKAKGKEWDRVFILDKDKYIPSPWAKKPWQLQQEHNLAYVAITRAKKELVYLRTTGSKKC